jgi:hypothetical protein
VIAAVQQERDVAAAAAEKSRRDAEAAEQRRGEAREDWLIETARSFERSNRRRTHREGWQVSRRELRELEDRGRRFKRWELLVLTPEGKLILFLQIPGLWGNKWHQVIAPDQEILYSVATFLGLPPAVTDECAGRDSDSYS